MEQKQIFHANINIPSWKSKETLKKYEELWNKIRHLILSIINKFTKLRQLWCKIYLIPDWDEKKLLSEKLELYDLIIFVGSAFWEGKKYYSQVFLDECLYKLQVLDYDRISMSEETNINQTNESHRRVIFKYLNFLVVTFRFQKIFLNLVLFYWKNMMKFNFFKDSIKVLTGICSYEIYFSSINVFEFWKDS